MAASIRHVSPGYFNLNVLNEPAVIKNITNSWPCSRWKIEYLAELLGDDKIRFRLGRKNGGGSGFQFEGDCIYEEATMKDFCEWCQHNSTKEMSQVASSSSSSRKSHRESQSSDVADPEHSEGTCMVHAPREESGNPLMCYECSQYWCYADYKHMKHLFMNCPSILEDVRWKDLGFSDHDGRQSTIWIGSEGANTPCHQDTYGFNLVAQIQGKKWHLFPPSQTELMYPTRIPYEESSIFSRVNVKAPDLHQHPKFGRATPYVVVLEPGDILFVPKLWWHYVESLDVSISINCWMDLESDHVSRVDEAIARTLVCGLMSLEGQEDDENERGSNASWLNPTEEATSTSTNLALLGAVVATALTRCSKASPRKEERSVLNLSENPPEALIKLKEGNPSLRQCHASENDTLEEIFEGTVDSDEKRESDVTPANVGERAALVEEMDSEINKGMPLHQQIPNAYCPPNLSTSPITINPIHGGSPTQGHVANSDSTCGELGRWQERKWEIEGTDQVQNQPDSAKRIKLCDDVIIPGSRLAVARQSVFSVPCHGSVTELTASHRGNDCANLKIEPETCLPSSAALETSDSFVDVTMATVVECLTQPNIIALLREGLLEKVWSKQRARTLDD